MLAYYSPVESAPPKTVEINVDENFNGRWNLTVLDKENTMSAQSVTAKDGKIVLEMPCESVMLLER